MCSLSMEHISDYAGKSFQSLPKKALDGDFSQEREKAIQPNKLNWCCWGETPPCSPTPPFIRSWLMDETMKPHGFFGGVAYPVTSCHRFLPVRSKAWVWIYRWPGDVQDFLPMRSFSIRASRHQGIQRASSIDPNAYKYINYLKPSGNRKKKKTWHSTYDQLLEQTRSMRFYDFLPKGTGHSLHRGCKQHCRPTPSALSQ